MKKTIARLIIILFPFLWVWVLAICTAWTYDPIGIFQSEDWITSTMFYYFAVAWIPFCIVETYFSKKD